ncbi:MAG: hypothetical protein J0L56_14995 [Chitinophagales bacterium]|nr:hypothetical protein [Chitinophagales bacterium]
MLKHISVLILVILFSGYIAAQDSVSVQLQVSKKYLDAVSTQAGSLEEKMRSKLMKIKSFKIQPGLKWKNTVKRGVLIYCLDSVDKMTLFKA